MKGVYFTLKLYSFFYWPADLAYHIMHCTFNVQSNLAILLIIKDLENFPEGAMHIIYIPKIFLPLGSEMKPLFLCVLYSAAALGT